MTKPRTIEEIVTSLNWCNCGDLEAGFLALGSCLKAHDTERKDHHERKQSWLGLIGDRYAMMIAQMLCSLNLLSHGVSVGAAFLDEDGRKLLNWIEAKGYERESDSSLYYSLEDRESN